jgi:hypothetical protein
MVFVPPLLLLGYMIHRRLTAFQRKYSKSTSRRRTDGEGKHPIPEKKEASKPAVKQPASVGSAASSAKPTGQENREDDDDDDAAGVELQQNPMNV